MRQFARESVELCELAEPDPLADLPSGTRWRARFAISICGTRQRCHSTRPRLASGQAGRAGGAAARSPRDQFRWRGRGSRDGRDRLCQLSRFFRVAIAAPASRWWWRRCATMPTQETQRSLLDGFALRFGVARPELVGLEAARRTLAKLGSRKIATCQVPAVFAPEAARALLGQLAAVISGGAVWRKSSYLAAREGTAVASPLVTVVDDPLRRRAPGRGLSTARGSPRGPMWWCPRVFCVVFFAMCTPRASSVAVQPDRRDGAWAAGHT